MFLQDQIEKSCRRLKNIEENPRPEFLQSNKIRYELEMEHAMHTLEAWKAGKPFAVFELGAHQLARPLGFEPMGFIAWGDRVKEPQKYLDIAVTRFGFPEHTCDRTMTALGLFLSGEVPVPRLVTTRRVPCEPERFAAQAAAKYLGALFFEVDKLNSTGYENIAYLAEQMGELIEFAEKSIPGIKYSEEKLVELLEMDQQALNYRRDTYELRKKVPCPISPQDAFRLTMEPSRHPNPAKVLAYCKAYRDELFERAEKGIGGVPEERLRIAWLATGPFGRATFDMLTRKGVSLPWFHYGVGPVSYGVIRDDYGDDSVYGRKLTPLEDMQRVANANVWGGGADQWVDPLIKACKELKIDAVVDFLQPGCVTTKNLKRITAQRVKEEVGIPTLDLEGREFFTSDASAAEMNRKLEEFLDMCIANKN
ncbi:MAG: 2-hydroxyacyl-CoA dehydratase [Chloroflexi bacterium]|nr:2-hydroxyacyl-CoA dehydratase [Chloroflexota bacterium]